MKRKVWLVNDSDGKAIFYQKPKLSGDGIYVINTPLGRIADDDIVSLMSKKCFPKKKLDIIKGTIEVKFTPKK